MSRQAVLSSASSYATSASMARTGALPAPREVSASTAVREARSHRLSPACVMLLSGLACALAALAHLHGYALVARHEAQRQAVLRDIARLQARDAKLRVVINTANNPSRLFAAADARDMRPADPVASTDFVLLSPPPAGPAPKALSQPMLAILGARLSGLARSLSDIRGISRAEAHQLPPSAKRAHD